jgi:type IX secretion system PorP/SprF family membrane protein
LDKIYLIRNIWICLISLLVSLQGNCQDIHWSQVNENELFLNPANTGNFKGDIRLHGQLRNQWRSVTIPYSTYLIAIDKPYKRDSSFAIGGTFFFDQAGDGQLRTIESIGMLSKKLNLSGGFDGTLTLAAQIGFNYKSINQAAFYFDNQFNGILFDPSLPTNEIPYNAQKLTATIGLGTLYDKQLNPNDRISIGISTFNLNRPNQGFLSAKSPRDMRLCLYTSVSKKIGSNLALLPSIFFSTQGKYHALILGSDLNYSLDKTQNFSITGGLSSRMLDALILKLGATYNSTSCSLSYDINYSTLIPASNFRGGIEFALTHILWKFKPSRALYKRCPDYL